jgi:hypothetical protein
MNSKGILVYKIFAVKCGIYNIANSKRFQLLFNSITPQLKRTIIIMFIILVN